MYIYVLFIMINLISDSYIYYINLNKYMSDILSIRTDRDTLQVIESIAVFNGITVSELLNQVLRSYITDIEDVKYSKEINSRLKEIADKIELDNEKIRLKCLFNEESKDIRIIRAVFYTLYYTRDFSRAELTYQNAVKACKIKHEVQKKNLKAFYTALSTRNLSLLGRYTAVIPSLKRIDIGELLRFINQNCK